MKKIAIIYIKYIRPIISFIFNAFYYIRMIITNSYSTLKSIQSYIYKDIYNNGWSSVISHSNKTEYIYDGIKGFPDWSGWGLTPYYRKIINRKYLKYPTVTEYVGDCDEINVVANYLKIYLNSSKVLEEHKGFKIELYSIISDNLLDLPKFHVVCFFYKTLDKIWLFSNGELINIFNNSNDILWYYQSMYKYKGKLSLVRL